MKEIRISLKLRIALRRHDVHWIEEELLRLREELFLGILERVLEGIEEEALRKRAGCRGCGGEMRRNGQEEKRLRTLVGSLKVRRIRVRCGQRWK